MSGGAWLALALLLAVGYLAWIWVDFLTEREHDEYGDNW